MGWSIESFVCTPHILPAGDANGTVAHKNEGNPRIRLCYIFSAPPLALGEHSAFSIHPN